MLAVSCSSVTKCEPVREDDSLVIGQLFCHFANYHVEGSLAMNGTVKMWIEITIADLVDGSETKTVTGSEGLFVLDGLNVSHKYLMKKIFYKYSDGGGWYSVWMRPDIQIVFSPVAGKVLNLGSYVEYSDDKSQESRLIRKDRDAEALFRAVYKDSEWNSREFMLYKDVMNLTNDNTKHMGIPADMLKI